MKSLLLTLALSLITPSLSFAAPTPLASGEDYYRQFLYTVETEDDGDGEVLTQYRYLMGEAEVVVSELKRIKISSSLFLLEDRRFIFAYSEMFMLRDTPQSEWRYMPNMDRGFCPVIVKGNWSAPEQKLVLSPEIEGDRATWDSRPSVTVTLNRALLSAEAAGAAINMDLGYGNEPMETSLGRGGFCPY